MELTAGIRSATYTMTRPAIARSIRSWRHRSRVSVPARPRPAEAQRGLTRKSIRNALITSVTNPNTTLKPMPTAISATPVLTPSRA